MYYKNGITITDFGMKCKFFLDIKYVIVKVHCSLLAEEGIHAALWDYATKNNISIEGLKKPKNDIDDED